jgi:hypothetical protein
MSEPLRVALPLGIGDTSFSCQKLRALSALHDNRPIHAYVNRSPNHMSVGFLELMPFIEKAFESKDAPYSISTEMPPSHRDPKWSTLEGCRDWKSFDYIMVANGHLERGEHISTWLPELDTDYTFDLQIPKAARYSMSKYENRALVYMSGLGPNSGFHGNWWMARDWVQVITGLVAEGLDPVLVGADTPDDRGYRDIVATLLKRRGIEVTDLVGQTSLAEYCAIIEAASCWVGLNSGGGIVSATQETPTVMLWADSDYPLAGVNPANQLHPAMQRGWLAPIQLDTYRTFSYGALDLTPAAVVKAVIEVAR